MKTLFDPLVSLYLLEEMTSSLKHVLMLTPQIYNRQEKSEDLRLVLNLVLPRQMSLLCIYFSLLHQWYKQLIIIK